MTPLFTVVVEKSSRTGDVRGTIKVHRDVAAAEVERGLLGVLQAVAQINDRPVGDLLENLAMLAEAN